MKDERKAKLRRLIKLIIPPLLFLGFGYLVLTMDYGGTGKDVPYELLFSGAMAEVRLKSGLYDKYGTLLSEERRKDPWGTLFREEVYGNEKFVLWSAGPDKSFAFNKGSDDYLVFHLDMVRLTDPEKELYNTMINQRYAKLGELLLRIEDGDYKTLTQNWLDAYYDSLHKTAEDSLQKDT